MKIAMVFPGYGSQFVGMAKELYDESRLIQEYFEEASNCLNVNFVKLCFASSEQDLSRIDNAYEAIFLVSFSIAAYLKQEGIVPEVVAGFGLGEYSALSSTGGLNLPDGLYFLSKYAQFYQEFLTNADVRIIKVTKLALDRVEKIIEKTAKRDQGCSVAIRISDAEGILTGPSAAVERCQTALTDEGAKVKEMPLGAGLHSSLMDPVIDQLRAYLEKIDFHDLSVPLISSLTGKMISKGDVVKEYSMQRIQQTLYWNSVIDQLGKYDIIIEVGPGSTLSRGLAERYPDKKIIAVNKPVDLDVLKKIVLPQSIETKNE
ncbi:MAG: ACP S-malonyltransferase [Candidatus Babeliales bacterium]